MAAAPVANEADTGAVAPTRQPNQYHLSGGGIAVAYYPDGLGPIAEPDGPICFVYQDANQSRSFRRAQVRAQEPPDLGTVVSVTLRITPDAGSTSFSLFIPAVRLPEAIESSSPITTLGITTNHRTFLFGPGPGQQEIYSAVQLAGEARAGTLPMLRQEA